MRIGTRIGSARSPKQLKILVRGIPLVFCRLSPVGPLGSSPRFPPGVSPGGVSPWVFPWVSPSLEDARVPYEPVTEDLDTHGYPRLPQIFHQQSVSQGPGVSPGESSSRVILPQGYPQGYLLGVSPGCPRLYGLDSSSGALEPLTMFFFICHLVRLEHARVPHQPVTEDQDTHGYQP